MYFLLTHARYSVVLQTFTVGAELALVRTASPGVLQSIWVLLVRFLAMPALSVLFVWLTAGKGWYVDDSLVWCVHVSIISGLVFIISCVQVLAGAHSGGSVGNAPCERRRAR